MKLSELVSARHLTDEQRAAAQELQGRGYESFTDIVQAIGEPALAVLSSVVAEPVAGLAGLATSTFGGVDRSVNVINAVRDKLTYTPKTEAGKSGMNTLGQVMKPVGDALTSAEDYLGGGALELTGSPALAAAAATIPSALMELNPVGKANKAATKMDIFAGKKAKNANLEQMEAAQELANRGMDRDTIWKETGWFQDVDNQWKWEIDDTPYFHGTASNIQDIDPKRFGESTDAHSAKQGFWQSSSPETAESYANYAARDAKIAKILRDADRAADSGDWDKYDELTVVAETMESESAAFKGQNIMPSFVSGKTKEIDLEGEDFMSHQDYINEQISTAKAEGYDSLKIKNLVDDVGLVGKPSDHIVTFNPEKVVSKFDEGLLSQPSERIDMTPEERAAKPPWQTLDVPEDELIVRGASNGPAMSMGGDTSAFIDSTGDSAVDSKVASIEMMTPDQYLSEAFKATDGRMGGDFDDWMRSNARTPQDVTRYSEAMKNGDKFPMPYIDKDAGSQDGRNRALAAKQAGTEEIPVAIIPEPSISEQVKRIKDELQTAKGYGKFKLEEKLKALGAN